MATFEALCAAYWRSYPDKSPTAVHSKSVQQTRVSAARLGCLVAFDPGETTGWALFRSGALDSCGYVGGGKPDSLFNVAAWLRNLDHVDGVVLEAFRLYPWQQQGQAWNEMYTSQVIGALRLVCYDRGVQCWRQGAQIKNFFKDDKLRSWGYFQTGDPLKRHSNDAIRHGCNFILDPDRDGMDNKY